jgi:hypothetical protein
MQVANVWTSRARHAALAVGIVLVACAPAWAAPQALTAPIDGIRGTLATALALDDDPVDDEFRLPDSTPAERPRSASPAGAASRPRQSAGPGGSIETPGRDLVRSHQLSAALSAIAPEIAATKDGCHRTTGPRAPPVLPFAHP